jgi:hypothetical protein
LIVAGTTIPGHGRGSVKRQPAAEHGLAIRSLRLVRRRLKCSKPG